MNSDSFSVLCLNVTKDSNIGNMIRTAGLLGCKHFFMAGRKKYDKRSTVGAHHYMNIQHLPGMYHTLINTHHTLDCDCGACKVVNTPALIDFIKSTSLRPVFIEQGGMSVVNNTWKLGSDNPLFIYGNESHGIPMSVIHQVQKEIPETCVVSVPQLGIMRSHNVATTCTIVLWEYNRMRLMRMDQQLL